MITEIEQIQEYFMKQQNVTSKEDLDISRAIGIHNDILVGGFHYNVEINTEGKIIIHAKRPETKMEGLKRRFTVPKPNMTAEEFMKEMYEQFQRDDEEWGLIATEDFSPDGEEYDNLKRVITEVFSKFQ